MKALISAEFETLIWEQKEKCYPYKNRYPFFMLHFLQFNEKSAIFYLSCSKKKKLQNLTGISSKISTHDKFFSLNLWKQKRHQDKIVLNSLNPVPQLHLRKSSYFSPVKLLLRYRSMKESESFKALRAKAPWLALEGS